MTRKIDMRQVAAQAGVSLATVSRVLSAPELVTPKTRNKVLKVIEENNYVYNAVAADLSRQRSTIIGVLIPSAKVPLFNSTIIAIQDYLQDKNYSIMVGNTEYEDKLELKSLKQFSERHVAGIIRTGFSVDNSEILNWHENSDIPCVFILEKMDIKNINYIGFDNEQSAFSATSYLTKLGHERIGLIIGPYSKILRIRKRYDGYKLALKAAGIALDPSLIIETNMSLEDGKKGYNKLLKLKTPPTAIFAAADMLAIGAMRAAKEAGQIVPDDISIMGHGDIDVSKFMIPSLSTVKVPGYECAKKAIRLLLNIVEGKIKNNRQQCLDVELAIRESCKAR